MKSRSGRPYLVGHASGRGAGHALVRSISAATARSRWSCAAALDEDGHDGTTTFGIPSTPAAARHQHFYIGADTFPCEQSIPLAVEAGVKFTLTEAIIQITEAAAGPAFFFAITCPLNTRRRNPRSSARQLRQLKLRENPRRRSGSEQPPACAGANGSVHTPCLRFRKVRANGAVAGGSGGIYNAVDRRPGSQTATVVHHSKSDETPDIRARSQGGSWSTWFHKNSFG